MRTYKTATPRKKPIPKRVVKKYEEVVIPDKEKYKILFDRTDTSDLNDRDIEKMVYMVEHEYKWDEIFKMSMNQVEDCVHKIKCKMTKEELEKDKLIFYLKANNCKNKQLKNMKTENLKKLVDEMKKEKIISVEDAIQTENLKEYVRIHKLKPATDTLRSLRFTVQSQKKYLEHSNTGNVPKKQRLNFHEDEEPERLRLIAEFLAMGYKEDLIINSENLMLLIAQQHVNVEEVSKEICSTTTPEGFKKISTEDKAALVKKKLKSSERIVESFEVEIENFSRGTLKEKITNLVVIAKDFWSLIQELARLKRGLPKDEDEE
ncbi:hypothetical protein L1987_13592 [Smallanthus sonchifolius]|uniref:Uncharacterized protein n=1 Tax=Smallanthus sonchifolius TaxID=185202 RepID=A0ACB9JGY2_9ASTR|nr:hypothetical protein L1987_13592 [Smallanthus sonchifolius]